MSRSTIVLAIAAVAVCFAVETNFWTYASSEDYDKSDLKRLSLRSDGRITLAPELKELQDASVSYLWAVARGTDGTLYTGGGNAGSATAKLFAVNGGKTRIYAELPELQIQSIALDGSGRVYAATSPDGKVYRIQANGQSEVFYDPKAKYIWSIAFDPTGNLYVATGGNGEIHKVDATGKGSVFFRTEEDHARSMAIDKAGNVIVGTEPGGLIVRVSPAGEGFVLHQANRREVTALAIARDGSIYASAVGSKPSQPTTPSPAPPPVAPVKSSTTITVTASGSGGAASTTNRPAPPTMAPSGVSGGSEVIHINADGFPSPVWSDASEVVYAITFDRQGRPIFGTGNKGGVYRVDSDLLSTKLLSLQPTQVTSMTSDPATGALYAVTGNIGKLFQIGPGAEADGVLESEVMDAGWFASWGRLTYKASGGVTFETRSGNLDRPQKNWSPWRPVTDRISSPPARFIQFRARMQGADSALTSIDVAYLPRNVAPKIEKIEIVPANYRFPNQSLTITPSSTLSLAGMSSKTPSGGQGTPSSDPGAVTLNYAKGYRGARWKAADPNHDTLEYDVEIRGVAEQGWKMLKKGLTVRQLSFDSTAFPDGEYVLRITARDSASNPPGTGLSDTLESEPFLVDNTPPVIRDVRATATGNRLTISFRAADARSILTKAEYSVNATDWVYIEPSTRLSDAMDHSYSITIDRPAGDASIAVRVSDEFENHSVENTPIR
jgi:hypothetical protein